MARRRGRGRARKASHTLTGKRDTTVAAGSDPGLFRSLGERVVARAILELAIVSLIVDDAEKVKAAMATGGGGWMAGIGRNLMGFLGGSAGDGSPTPAEQPKSGCKNTRSGDHGQRSKGQQRRAKRQGGGSAVMQERKNARHSSNSKTMQDDTSPNKRKEATTKTVVGPSTNKTAESCSGSNDDAKTAAKSPPVVKNGGMKMGGREQKVLNNDLNKNEKMRGEHVGGDDIIIESGSELAKISTKEREKTGRNDGNSPPRSPTTDPKQIPIVECKEEEGKVSVDRSGFQTTGKQEGGKVVGEEEEEKKPHGSLETVTQDCAAAQNEQLAVSASTAVYDEGGATKLIGGECDNDNDDSINNPAMIVGASPSSAAGVGGGREWAGRGAVGLSHAASPCVGNIEIPEGRGEATVDLDAVAPNYGSEVQISACRTELQQLQQTEEEERSPSSPSPSSYRRANNKVDMPAERSETELEREGGSESPSSSSYSSDEDDDASQDEIWEEDLESDSEEDTMDLPPPLPPKLPAKGAVPPPPPPPPQSYRKMVEDSLRHHKQSEDLLKDFMTPQKKSGRKSSRKEHRRRTSEKRLPPDDKTCIQENPEPCAAINSTHDSVNTTPDSERKRKKSKKSHAGASGSSLSVNSKDDSVVQDDAGRSPLRDTPPTPPVLGRKHYKLQKTESTKSQSSLPTGEDSVQTKHDLAKSKSVSHMGRDGKKSGKLDDKRSKHSKDARRKSEARLEPGMTPEQAMPKPSAASDDDDEEDQACKREVLSLDKAHNKFDRKYGGEMGAFRKSLREEEEENGGVGGIALLFSDRQIRTVVF